MKTYPLFKVHVNAPAALAQISNVFNSGFINEGTQVTELTEQLSQKLASNHLLLTNSCTSALTMALKLAGVGPGDDVVSTPMTCVATNTPIVAAGANIVWADVDPEHGMLDGRTIRNAITPRTKAVIVVGWGGTPPDLHFINDTFSIWKGTDTPKIPPKIILDAAHCFGALYEGLPIHRYVDYTCFPGSTLIETNIGKKRICDIREGDLVLTSTGDFRPVIACMKRKYKGEWTTIKVGQARISATSNHPVRIFRDGKDDWLPIGDVRDGDHAYVKTKKCSRCNQNLIPHYMSVCKSCYVRHNRSDEKREQMRQIALSRLTSPKRQTSRTTHHEKHVSPIMEQYRVNGYRVIPMIFAFPDFLALKDNKIVSVEVESGCYVNERKLNKYDKLGTDTYDDVIWHCVGARNEISCKHRYEIIGTFARVPVWNIKKHTYRDRTRTVFNLSVADDPTYVAGGILVHNCYSFQAIKHFTTGDGGALVCADPLDYHRAKAMKWFGLDRDRAKDDKGNWKGQQWDVDIEEAGYKFNMNNVAAAIGLSQIPLIDDLLAAHRSHAHLYNQIFLLNNPAGAVTPARRPMNALSSHWVYTMKVNPNKSKLNRDELLRALNAEGIMAGVVHVPNDDYTAFKQFKKDLPGVREFSANQFSLPCGWWLSDQDIIHIADRVKALTK